MIITGKIEDKNRLAVLNMGKIYRRKHKGEKKDGK